ncbi:unnamed protein product [Acanthoscelides obtectus]|uniref:DDE-1 domain-containing protein n=1 Tax=Acanthoscelides obtectus TaxID=200917 RepID=A0A9P0PX51_ACAOB|nr:unnamed protein product [Acanthoscelides obtectus]CAK1681177.1 Jerky protein homolog-like [Acanthoscelides obtectus]
MGRKPVFSREQETEIRDQILLLASMFYGLTPQSLKAAVFTYADWMYGFLKRNSEISIRRPEPTSVNRILAFNATEVQIFFDNLSSTYDKYRFRPHRIFNVDETGINAVHKPGKILAPKGIKQVGSATSWERGKNITICCCISATGQYVPPLIIYPRLRMHPSLEQGGPNGSSYRCNKSGWMTEELFYAWLVHFAEHTKPSLEDPVLLILDNHSSHISVRIYDFCRQNGIIMLTIPPHTSHRTQPLDITVYSPLKTALHKECDAYMKLHQYEKLTPLQLIPLFTQAYLNVANAEKALSGFRASGIWPFNPNVFSQLIQEGNDNASDRISAEQAIVDIRMESENVEASSALLDIPMDFNERSYLVPTNTEPNESADDSHPSTSGIQNSLLFENPEPEIAHNSLPSKSATQTEIEHAKRQLFVTPVGNKTPEHVIPFSEISPAPEKKHISKGKGIGKRTKQQSKLLTSTPVKSVLEKIEEKRVAKKKKLEEHSETMTKKLKKRKNKTSFKKQMIKESSSSSDEDLHVLCDDEEELDDDFSEGRGGETGVEELYALFVVISGRITNCGTGASAVVAGRTLYVPDMILQLIIFVDFVCKDRKTFMIYVRSSLPFILS